MSSANMLRTISQWDLAGVGVSVVCVIHCVAPPLLLLALPAFGVAWLTDRTLGWIFIGIAASIAMTVLGAGVARHGHREALGLGIAGLAIMAVGHGLASAEWETVAGVVGGVALIAAHLRNRALIQSASRCHCSACAVDADGETDPAPASVVQGSSAVAP